MNGKVKLVLEVLPFALSIFLLVISFLQDQVAKGVLEQTIRVRHPVKVDEEVVPGIARYAVDIFGRLNFFAGMCTSIIGAIIIGINRESKLYILAAVCLFVSLLYIGTLLIWKTPVGKQIKWPNPSLVFVNVILILGLLM